MKRATPKKKFCFLIGLILLILTVGQISFSKPPAVKRRAAIKVILEHADTLRTNNGARYLLGHVRIRRADRLVVADKAIWDETTGFINISGRVKLTEPGQSMTARRISHYEDLADYEASGDVDFLREDSIRIRCQFARYAEDEETLYLRDEVIIDNLSDGTRLTGEDARWFKLTETAIIEGQPVYRLPNKKTKKTGADSLTGPDTLVIKSEVITFHKNENTALFTGEVDMSMDDLLAVADSLFHDPDSNRTELYGAPVIWRGKDQLSGREVKLRFLDQVLNKIFINGDAVILSEAHDHDLRRNRLAGKDMIINVINDSTRHLNVKGDAQGEYHVWDEQDEYQGVNISAANTIEITIQKNTVTEINLIGSTAGAFYPPDQAPPLREEEKIIRNRFDRD